MNRTLVYLNNLPAIPADILHYSLDIEDYWFGTPDRRKLIRNDTEFVGGVHRRQQTNPELETWVKTNIVNDWYNIGYGRDFICNGPHRDRSSPMKLIYLIDPGGVDVRTVFYDARFQKVDMVAEKYFYNNYDQLEEIESHVLTAGQWYYFYGLDTIHSVENIQTTRVTLQIGLQKDILQELQAK